MVKKLTHYFAYGSNMHHARLRRRLDTIFSVESVCLERYALTFGKRGRDGSAKCTIEATDDDRVFGVLFRLPEALLVRLDAIEGSGYVRFPVQPVGLDSGRTYRAHCYRARPGARADGLLPFDWYRAFVVDGARMHGLPEAWVSRLANTPARSDPNGYRRRRQNRQLEQYSATDTGGGPRPVAGPKTGWFVDDCYRDRYHDVAPRYGL